MDKKTKDMLEDLDITEEAFEKFTGDVTKMAKRSFGFVAFMCVTYLVVYGTFLLGLVAGVFFLFKFFFGG